MDNKEPYYEGRSLGDWIKALKDDSPATRGQAAEAIEHLGPRARTAVPVLIDTLKDVVPVWKKENWEDGSQEWIHPGLAQ